ncbi:hypothetical protein [Pseudorhodoferax sp.]|uniref:hypothetical protein n=1 Tax=Pseudorhodoferax sp. TaxID=1993553 RepID=UPI002DD6897D|nr:hypothetical protein [Pseudorhodoferax sp.]
MIGRAASTAFTSTPATAWPLEQLGPPEIGGKLAGPRGLPMGPRCADPRVLQAAWAIEALGA